MQLQEGIGRGGYRLLASVFVALGVLGLITTLYAFKSGQARGGFFDWLGFGLTLAALALLYGMLLFMLLPHASSQRAKEPVPAPVAFTPAPRPIDFEMPEHEIAVEETGPEVAVPLPPEKPKAVLPPNRNIGRDAKGWPQRTGPSGITRGEWKEAQQGQLSPRAPRSATGSGAVLEPEPSVPVAIARIGDPKDDPDWTPQGMARGKCGGCGSILLAPPERPIRLRCPKCGKEQMLR